MQQNAGSCCISSLLAYVFFIGELSPLILRDIKERYLLVPDMFVFVGGFMCLWLSAFDFVVQYLISCPFFGTGIFLLLEFSFQDPL